MNHFGCLLQSHSQHAGMILDAMSGDGLAVRAVLDLAEEEALMLHPFEVGKVYLFQTVTLYFVGRVVKVEPCWIHLENASWVHRTGRLSVVAAKSSFDRKHHRTLHPRTEYVGKYIIPVAPIVGVMPFDGDPPTESIQ